MCYYSLVISRTLEAIVDKVLFGGLAPHSDLETIDGQAACIIISIKECP